MSKFHRAYCSRPPSGSICSVFRSEANAQPQPNRTPRSDRGSMIDEAGLNRLLDSWLPVYGTPAAPRLGDGAST